MVRNYKPKDIEDVFDLLKEFHEEILSEFVGFNAAVVRDSILSQTEHAIVLEIDDKVVGIISGKEIDYPLQEAKIFQEMIWYVSKKHRRYGITLLRELEKQCKERGNSAIIMVHLYNNSEKMGKLYELMGYKEMETHYIRSLL